jgi:hypothetical protein
MRLPVIIMISGLFCSCVEKGTTNSYFVTNFTDARLRIEATFHNKTQFFDIAPGNRQTILVQSAGIGDAEKNREKADALHYITGITMLRDTIPSKTDFTRTSQWIFTGNSEYSAHYVCEVFNEDF